MMDVRVKIDIKEIVAYLNLILEIDREAVSKVFLEGRTKCNEDLANHPTVAVGIIDGDYHVGALGLLNGFFTDEDTIGMDYYVDTRLIQSFNVVKRKDFTKVEQE